MPLANYNPYTNPQFLENRRSSSLFFQNAKKFFVVFLPFTVIVFILLNRLFWLLLEYKVSIIFRNYSFWMELGMMLLVQNITLFNYYFLQNIETIFSIDFQTKVLNFIVLFMYGFFVPLCVLFLPFTYYLYDRLSAYFLENFRVSKAAFEFSVLRFIIRPIL